MIALERATLYGIVIYNNRRVNFGQRRPGGGARDLHPRGAGRRRVGDAAALPGAQPQADARRCEELEHKSRRQDVLVDDELIYAFYDQQLPRRRVLAAPTLRALVPRRGQAPARSCCSSRATS